MSNCAHEPKKVEGFHICGKCGEVVTLPFTTPTADSSAPTVRTQSAQGMLHAYCEGTHHNVLEKREVLELMNAYAESRLLAVREYVERRLALPMPSFDESVRKLLTDIQEIVKGEK